VKGPPAEAVWLLIRAASQLDQIAAQGYELRLLNIPALYFEGLRLLALDQGNDIVLALNPLGEKVKLGSVLSSTELLNLAQPFAAARLAASDPNLMTA
jgi:ABC-type branched-subunit amino acid transport system substrate-binding protein